MPVYSRPAPNDDNDPSTEDYPFVKQYDGDGAHFSAVATAYLSPTDELVPFIHFVTNDGSNMAFYARYQPGQGMTKWHPFDSTFYNGIYEMQAAYMHISCDPDPTKPTLLATFSAKDKRPGLNLPKEAKALLTFTSNNGGGTWNDTTPYAMVPYNANTDTGEPRFEMPAIIRYPHVFLEQVENMDVMGPSKFTFFSYSLPQPATN